MADVTIDDYTLRNALYGAARDCGTTAFEQCNFEREHHHIGDDTGRLALAALRSLGSHDAMVVVVEYLATAPAHQRRGLAGALIAEIRRRHPDAVVRASTDDDAIGFYRGLGFLDSPAPVDPRWPGRQPPSSCWPLPCRGRCQSGIS